MKNLLLIATLLCCVAANAQVDEEALYLNGGINFSTSDASISATTGFDSLGTTPLTISATTTTFGINAGGGYMFTEVFGAGLALGFSSSSTKPEIDTLAGTNTTNIITIAPNARAFIEIDEPLYLTGILTVGIGLGTIKSEFAGIEADQSFNTFSVLLTPGFTYFFSDNIALDVTFGMIGYQETSQTLEGDLLNTDANAGGFVFGFDTSTLNFGLTIMLNN